ncbi:uncharacterized protein JCM6883_007133 [Sporobolomyces salmoneus]|uniref:uncharacterized protein n=1 Tax=Sporobolomyces salmoneus TaxID=183962 RepID=UPI00316B82CB
MSRIVESTTPALPTQTAPLASSPLPSAPPLPLQLLLAQAVCQFGVDASWTTISQLVESSPEWPEDAAKMTQQGYETVFNDMMGSRGLNASACGQPRARPVRKLIHSLYSDLLVSLRDQILASHAQEMKLRSENHQIATGQVDKLLFNSAPQSVRDRIEETQKAGQEDSSQLGAQQSEGDQENAIDKAAAPPPSTESLDGRASTTVDQEVQPSLTHSEQLEEMTVKQIEGTEPQTKVSTDDVGEEESQDMVVQAEGEQAEEEEAEEKGNEEEQEEEQEEKPSKKRGRKPVGTSRGRKRATTGRRGRAKKEDVIDTEAIPEEEDGGDDESETVEGENGAEEEDEGEGEGEGENPSIEDGVEQDGKKPESRKRAVSGRTGSRTTKRKAAEPTPPTADSPEAAGDEETPAPASKRAKRGGRKSRAEIEAEQEGLDPTAKESKQLAARRKTAYNRIIETIRSSLPFSSSFDTKVTKSQAPNYSTAVQRPTCLRDITKKIKNGEIKDNGELTREFAIMCANAVQFNGIEGEVSVGRQAQELFETFERLAGSSSTSSELDATSTSTPVGTSYHDEDPFDEFDRDKETRTNGDHGRFQGEDRDPKQDVDSAEALVDRVSTIFPSIDGGVELALLEEDIGGQDSPPEWLRETSGRITSIALGCVDPAGVTLERGDADDRIVHSERRRRPTRRRRVAVGSADGLVWIFRNKGEASDADNLARRRHERDSTIIAAPVSPSTLASTTTKLPRPSPTSTRASSPLNTSPPPRASLSPQLTTRRSSASLSTLSSFTSQSALRHASGPPSLNGSTTTTYSELRSLADQRLRKASATVSVSTTSVTPSPGPHRHSLSQDSSTHGSESPEDSPVVTLPPLSPVEPSIYPLSPTPNRPPPEFRFSPSTPSNDPESNSNLITPSPRIHHSSSSGVSSRKERLSRKVESRNTSHSRGPRKESITNGIGLWEDSSTTESPIRVEEVRGSETIDRQETIDEEKNETSDLEPALKVLTPGFGRVVAIRSVEQDHVLCSSHQERERGGELLIVLRESGHLSAISLLDGHCLATCDSRTETRTKYTDLQILREDSGRMIAFCAAGEPNSAVVCIDLDTFSTIETVKRIEHFAVSALHDSILAKESTILGTLEVSGKLRGLRTNGSLVVWWDESDISVAGLGPQQITQVARMPLPRIRDIVILPGQDRFVVVTRDSIRVQRVMTKTFQPSSNKIELERQFELTGVEAVHHYEAPISSNEPPKLLYSTLHANGSRMLNCLELDTTFETRTLYRSPSPYPRPRVTRTYKVDSESILFGFSDGTITLRPISSLGTDFSASDSDVQLSGAVSLLDVVDLDTRQVVVAGSVNGTVGFWTLPSLQELATFSLFASPIVAHASLSLPRHSQAFLFVSSNSPTALVSIDPPQVILTLPGSRTPTQLVATTKQGEILVLYRQGLARVWDAGIGELRRSMDEKTAQGVLRETAKEWRIWFDEDDEKPDAAISSMALDLFWIGYVDRTDPSANFDLRALLDDVSRDLPWSSSHQRTSKKLRNGFDSLDATPDISRSASPAQLSSPESGYLGIVKRWLSNLIPFGDDEDCDRALEQLGIVPSPVQLELATNQSGSLAFPAQSLAKSAWTISGNSTARRLLMIVCLLRVFLNFPATERVASEAIVYFSACLEGSIGNTFQEPRLEFFVDYWLDKNSEVQQAARTLFGTYLASLPDQDTLKLVSRLESCLPVRSRSGERLHARADTAILVIGLVAIDRFKLLATSLLADLSASVASYLDDSQHPFHRAIATELCSRGFHIWQNYVDAPALVRQLFSIAIGRDPSTPSDLRAMARQATVHVAGVNSPLFMSTLLFDILNAPTAISRNATLKLLGFIIRKKPLVLYHSLPRVVEAVVRSLDPTISDLRETVHQTATVIFNELVRTFPSIDFHGKSQRLAVGTQEGSAIVYDLKTATRLYVLEGHHRPLAAVSWSPDGHRLATVSLEESKVCIWKTGMGILSLIGAPTQRGGSQPFKTWDFHVGDEALMTTAATLEWILVDWPAERTVRLRIRETALSFGA